MHIAMIGTRGVPATYGGFETAVEEVGSRLVRAGHHVTVYCRTSDPSGRSYQGMTRVVIPAIHHKVAETLSHSTLATFRTVFWDRPDAAILFNAANAPLLPVLRLAGIPSALHVDGLEWKRTKWNGAGKLYYRFSERLAVRLAPALIADSRAIASYYARVYNRATVYIPYGAPLCSFPDHHRLSELGLKKYRYYLVVARFEPENHVHEIVTGYLSTAIQAPLVVVGAAPYNSDYLKRLQQSISSDRRIISPGPIWDQELLNQLYAGSRAYLHGHSVGGTNPSLLRAMGAGCPTIAFDVEFNREVLGRAGSYFRNPADIAHCLTDLDMNLESFLRSARQARAALPKRYDWDDVAEKYETLLRGLSRGAAPRRMVREGTN